MPFMERQVEFGRWVIIDGPAGGECFPAEVVGTVAAYHGELTPIPDSLREYAENRHVWSIDVRDGWGARWLAPGYLDCTPWSVFDTEQEAIESLEEDEP